MSSASTEPPDRTARLQTAGTVSPLWELFRLAFPIIVSQGSFAVMVFTDRWFMSRIDAVHMAATLGGGVTSLFCLSLFLGLITYTNALVAQYYGTGNLAKCPRVVTQGLLVALACTPLLFLAGWYGGGIFALMGHDPAQVPLEKIYYQVLMAGSLFNLVKACFGSYFSGIGRTRVVMVADVLSVCLNIPLSWALIFGRAGLPELGIAGAALGTVVANLFAIGLYAGFYAARSHRRQFGVDRAWQFDRGIMRRFLRLGAPSGLETFMNVATFNLFLLLFQSYGVAEGAAMAIVFNWDMLSFVPMTGLGVGVTSLVGRFVGAADLGRADRIIGAGFVLALSYAGVLAVLFLTFREALINAFATPAGDFAPILALASPMMIGLCSYMLADATILVAGGALRGAGDTRWIMITSTSLHWLMLLVQIIVITVLELGPLVSWWVMVAMLLALAALYLRRLLGGVWRQPERLAAVMRE